MIVVLLDEANKEYEALQAVKDKLLADLDNKKNSIALDKQCLEMEPDEEQIAAMGDPTDELVHNNLESDDVPSAPTSATVPISAAARQSSMATRVPIAAPASPAAAV